MKKFIPGSAPPLLTLVLLCLLAACKKNDPDLLIEGRVLEYGTETPIENATVTLRSYDGEFLGPVKSTVVATRYSGANGDFSMPYPDRNVLWINATKYNYFSDDFSEVLVTDAYKEDIHLHPYAWLRVNIRNESGAWRITAPGETSLDLNRMFFLDIGQDTTFYLLQKGNIEYKYIFGIKPVENEPSLNDYSSVTILENGERIYPNIGIAATWLSLTPPGHDTTDITIIY